MYLAKLSDIGEGKRKTFHDIKRLKIFNRPNLKKIQHTLFQAEERNEQPRDHKKKTYKAIVTET